MAYEFLFANNATTTLAESISATATVINVASGEGSLFPSPASGQAFAVTLVDAATGLTNEICYCTSRSGDALTVVRGQEGKDAIAWSAGDTVANYITADVMESWLQESDIAGYVSGTEDISTTNGDKAGTGLRLDGSTGNAAFTYDGGSMDLASYSSIVTMPTLYSSSTSLTVASGKSIAIIKLVGGGGAGCSVKGSSIADSVYGAGGGAGGYVYFWVSVSKGDVLVITVGAGASSPTNTVGGESNGGDTIVTLNGTEIARAYGGSGGIWNSSSSCAGGGGGSVTTQSSATSIEYANGTDGGDGQTGSSSIASVSGYGGAGIWGGGGRAGNGGGIAGAGFGAGGGGAYDTSYSNTFYSGGAGHDGCAVVEFR